MAKRHRLIPGKLCRNGHLLAGDNLSYSLVRGYPCYRCKACAVIRNHEVRGENKVRLPELERFLSNIKKTNTCWNYLGAGRYGIFTPDSGIPISAHKYSYERFKAKVDAGLVVDHTCNNTRCVNPEHLIATTQKKNAQRGSKVKLTQELANMIRADSRIGEKSCSIAIRYRVSQGTVSMILNNKIWI